VQWSPQGDIVLVITETRTLWRYDARTLATIDHSPDVVWASYSSSGRWLFTQAADRTSAIRDANDPANMILDGLVRAWQHPQSAWIVTVDASGSALRPQDNPTQIALASMSSVHFSPDGTHVLTFDPASGFVLRDADLLPLEAPSFPDVAARRIEWSPNGEQIAFFSDDDAVQIVSLTARTVSRFLLRNQARYNRVEWSPDSTRLLNSDDSGNFRVLDVATGVLSLTSLTGEQYLPREQRASDPNTYYATFSHVTWSVDGSHVFRCIIYGDGFGTCHIYDAIMGTEVGQIPDGSALYPEMRDAAGRYFVTSEGLFDARTGAQVAQFDAQLGGNFRRFSPDGRWVFLGSTWVPDVGIYDLNAHQLAYHIDIPPGRYDGFSMNWSPDSAQWVMWGGYQSVLSQSRYPSGLISFWDVHTGREVGRITEHIVFGQKMAFSPDSTQLAAADNLGNIALFDAENGDLLHTVGRLAESASIIAWQPDGALLAATTGRSSFSISSRESPLGGTLVHIWDMRTGELIAVLDHEATVLALLWHPTGRFLITDDNRGMSIWDAETGERAIDRRMIGRYLVGPDYRWMANGTVLVRRHYNCSLGGTLNLLVFTTLQHISMPECQDALYDLLPDGYDGLRAAQSVAERLGQAIPRIVSPDGRLGARITAGVLHVWRLDE
jgi:WD40 repeat protein